MQYELRQGRIVGSGTRIFVNFLEMLNFYRSFYESHGVNVPKNFAKVFRFLWERHQGQILREVEAHGFDFLLLGLPVVSIEILDQQMNGSGTIFDFDPKSLREPGVGVPRLVLMHRDPEISNNGILRKTFSEPPETFLNGGSVLALSDYLVFRQVIAERDGFMVDRLSQTWCPGSKNGAETVAVSSGYLGTSLTVTKHPPGFINPNIGCRLCRYFI